MPLLNNQLTPGFLFKNPHANTIYKFFYPWHKPNYKRERVATRDDDFIDLDFLRSDSCSLVVLIHGLEGSSQSGYMLSATNYIHNSGHDVICMNLRGCSGTDNNILKTYHAGKTDDIDYIIHYLTEKYNYKNITLCGFSLGGNLVLKYLGEYKIPETVKGGIAVSAPVDLAGSQAELNKFKNKIYMQEFLRTLKSKILIKAEKFPEYNPDKKRIAKVSCFKDFEELYTVPVFGFQSSEDYWEKSSSKPYLSSIKHEALLINAKDDSFLSSECYPYELAENSDNFYLMTPKYGGHAGFISSFNDKSRWVEKQIINFIQNILNICS